MTRKQFFWFWGAMDAIYLVRYWVTSAVEGRVPYLSDIESALWVLRDHSVLQIYTFGLVMLLQISIVASCFLFLLSSQKVRWLVYLQTPLRLVFFIPSVSLLLIGAQLVPGYSVVVMAVLVVASEAMKVWSIWRWGKKSGVSSTRR